MCPSCGATSGYWSTTMHNNNRHDCGKCGHQWQDNDYKLDDWTSDKEGELGIKLMYQSQLHKIEVTQLEEKIRVLSRNYLDAQHTIKELHNED